MMNSSSVNNVNMPTIPTHNSITSHYSESNPSIISDNTNNSQDNGWYGSDFPNISSYYQDELNKETSIMLKSYNNNSNSVQNYDVICGYQEASNPQITSYISSIPTQYKMPDTQHEVNIYTNYGAIVDIIPNHSQQKLIADPNSRGIENEDYDRKINVQYNYQNPLFTILSEQYNFVN